MVDALYVTWGCEPHEADGKVVYGLLGKPGNPDGPAENCLKGSLKNQDEIGGMSA